MLNNLYLLKMAGVERFELPTVGFGDRCSTNWNYTPSDCLYSNSYTYRVNLSFLGIKRYSRSEALLYSAQCFTQEVFMTLIKLATLFLNETTSNRWETLIKHTA